MRRDKGSIQESGGRSQEPGARRQEKIKGRGFWGMYGLSLKNGSVMSPRTSSGCVYGMIAAVYI